MRQRYSGVGRGTAVVVALLGIAACQPAMETEDEAAMGSGVPRLEGTSVPDIHGVWQAFSEVEYNLEGQAAQPARCTTRPARSCPRPSAWTDW